MSAKAIVSAKEKAAAVIAAIKKKVAATSAATKGNQLTVAREDQTATVSAEGRGQWRVLAVAEE